jgi:hypothetical protein
MPGGPPKTLRKLFQFGLLNVVSGPEGNELENPESEARSSNVQEAVERVIA